MRLAGRERLRQFREPAGGRGVCSRSGTTPAAIRSTRPARSAAPGHGSRPSALSWSASGAAYGWSRRPLVSRSTGSSTSGGSPTSAAGRTCPPDSRSGAATRPRPARSSGARARAPPPRPGGAAPGRACAPAHGRRPVRRAGSGGPVPGSGDTSQSPTCGTSAGLGAPMRRSSDAETRPRRRTSSVPVPRTRARREAAPRRPSGGGTGSTTVTSHSRRLPGSRRIARSPAEPSHTADPKPTAYGRPGQPPHRPTTGNRRDSPDAARMESLPRTS
jgi:hypothetical protein